MRMIFGMVLGALATVGAAYLHDAHTPNNTPNPLFAERPLVNWDVVGKKWEIVTARASAEWKRLTS